ncbi:MAG: hypothetical protein JXA28_05525 [Bacteroidetes bacterium]|nr:hypothetical protein [Bacteroidota bacterium]
MRLIGLVFSCVLLGTVLTGCSVHQTRMQLIEDRMSVPTGNVTEIILLSGESRTFESSGAAFDRARDVMVGTDLNGIHMTIPADSILYLRTEYPDSGRSVTTTFAWIGVILAVLAAIAAGGA